MPDSTEDATDPAVATPERSHEKSPHPTLRFFRQIGPAGPFALLVTALPAVGAIFVFSLAPKVIVPWLQTHGWFGLATFVTGFTVLGGLALAPTYANSIVGGWTYKFAVGFPAVMVGLGGAAMVSYVLAHRIVGHRVEDVIHQHPRWELVKDALVGGSTLKSIGMVALMRLSPALPFETTNALLAMCGVRPLPFLIGTLIGVAPRTAAIVFAASEAHRLDLHAAGGRWLLAAGIVTTIVCVVLIAWIAKHALNRATGAVAKSE
jgi:uncharacterized membrane protein YdjX (TVP38/TMEM64 family)